MLRNINSDMQVSKMVDNALLELPSVKHKRNQILNAERFAIINMVHIAEVTGETVFMI